MKTIFAGDRPWFGLLLVSWLGIGIYLTILWVRFLCGELVYPPEDTNVVFALLTFGPAILITLPLSFLLKRLEVRQSQKAQQEVEEQLQRVSEEVQEKLASEEHAAPMYH